MRGFIIRTLKKSGNSGWKKEAGTKPSGHGVRPCPFFYNRGRLAGSQNLVHSYTNMNSVYMED